MESPKETTKMTFFLNSNTEKKLNESEKKTETYIIIQNNHLHKENIDLRQEKIDLRHQNQEMEEELDRNDKSLRYLRSLQKNLKLLNDENEKVVKDYELLFKSLKTLYKTQNSLMQNFGYLFLSFFSMFVTFYLFNFFNRYIAVGLFLLLSLFNYGYYRFYLKLDYFNYKKDNKKMQESMKVKLKYIKEKQVSMKDLKRSLPDLLEMIDNC
jgi:hypothetical protein|tara:strand:- start:7126 stop:7758 length:633 start_codon:yes stop_codon:yes gene_type:complete